MDLIRQKLQLKKFPIFSAKLKLLAKPLMQLIVLFCVFFASFSVFADNDPYSVKDIVVEKTDKSAKEAQDKALVETQLEAFKRLIARMVLSEEVDKIPATLKVDDVAPLIRSFSVSAEKLTSNTYTAIFSYTFHPHLVKAFFDQYQVSYIENFIPDMLILPVMVKNSQVLLWDEDNSWMSFWKNNADLNSQLPYRLPLSDVEDLFVINAGEAFVHQRDKLDLLADKYRLKDIMLCVLTSHAESDQIDVDIVHHATTGEKILQFPSFSKKGPLTPDVFKDIKDQMLLSIWDIWKSQGTLVSSQAQELLCFVETMDLKGWQDIKSRLQQVRLIQDSKLLTISKGMSQISITFSDTLPSLSQELLRVGLELTPQDSRWKLSLK
jgi:hypothetical protein